MSSLRKLFTYAILTAILLCPAELIAQSDNYEPKTVELDEVLVEAVLKDGSVYRGYKVDIFESLGPLGDRKILDTPYSMFAMGSDLFENTITGNLEQIFRMNPLVSRGVGNSDTNQISAPALRGFIINSTFVDGVAAKNQGMGIFLEDKEKVEIYTGLSGFLFGGGNVGGVVNYITKRPTPYYLNKITVGYRGGSSLYGHADIGGPIMGGKFGYRINVMYQDGDTEVNNQSLRKQLISAAFDLNLTDSLRFQINGTYNCYELDGRQGLFNLSNSSSNYWHSPVKSSKLYAPKNSYHDVESYNLGANVKWRFNDYLGLRTAYSRKYDTRQMFFATGQRFIVNSNRYGFNLMVFDRHWTSNAGNAYIDAEFNTFSIGHKVTFGGDLNYNVYKPMRYRLANGAYSVNPRTANMAGLPTYIFDWGTQPFNIPSAERLYSSKEGRFKQIQSFNKNLMVGDEIKFTDQWIILAGLNLANIETKNYNVTTKNLSAKYDKTALTPSVALMFKPLPNVTIYTSYIEALEQGSIVGSGYTNTGESMSPVRSKQYEVGFKAELRSMLLTLALFQIEKASLLDKLHADGTKTLTKNGKQVNRGLEFTFSGKLFEKLTLVGGATYIDAEIRKSNTPSQNGNVPRGLPEFTAKLYAEYDLPFVEGLTLTGGVYYIGSTWMDYANTSKLKAYTTGDLGVRYSTNMLGPETTFRLVMTNVTNTRYWIGFDPANVEIGRGRTVYFSATTGF